MFKIYKIINEDNQIYIGSTKQKIQQRFSGHKYQIKKGISRCSLNHFNMNTARIELIEAFDCENMDEVKYKEREYIENTVCVNKDRPIVTPDEKIEQVRFWKKTKGSVFYTCDCGSKIQIVEKARHERSKRHQKFII